MIFPQYNSISPLLFLQISNSRILMHIFFTLSILLGVVITVAIIQIKKTHLLKNNMVIERERLAQLGEFTAGIVHNLRTPVMSISGSLEALKELVDEYKLSIGDKNVTNDDHHEIAKEMEEHILKTKSYCAYLSNIVTTVKKQAAVKKHSIDKSFMIRDMIKILEMLMGYELKKATCSLNINIKAEETLKIRGDVNELVQVMNNLISNSIDSYKGEPGEISVLIDKEEDALRLKVIDYGKGIPETVRKKLLKNIITTKGKDGTGLGIYISNYLIKNKFKGSMEIKSKEGKGTTVYVNIPIKQIIQ